MSQANSDPILAFFHGTGRDHAGRQLNEILAWSDHQLEFEHDYIQWLFPLKQPSRFNPDAPILQETSINAFLQNASLRQTLLKGFRRMMVFYGFVIRTFPDGTIQLDPVADFSIRSRAWLTSANHNYLRLTRILSSLQVLGCGDEAFALFDVLDLVYHGNKAVIGKRTYEFWCSAMMDGTDLR